MYAASIGRHQNANHPTATSIGGKSQDVIPSTWYDASERNEPAMPTRFSGGASPPELKNHTASVGL